MKGKTEQKDISIVKEKSKLEANSSAGGRRRTRSK
jgi:hypothetical protein